MRLDPLSRTVFQLSIDLRPTFGPCHAWMASALGHAGRSAEGRVSLSRFEAIGVGSIEAFATRRFHDPASRAVFLDGIAALSA